MRVDLEALLRAHSYLQVERPPQLWEVDADDEPFIRLLGELIVFGLVRGNELGDLTLNVSNVRLEEDDGGDLPPPGDYVAVTIRGAGNWAPEQTWTPARAGGAPFATADLETAAATAGAAFAYSRVLSADSGSITVWFARG